MDDGVPGDAREAQHGVSRQMHLCTSRHSHHTAERRENIRSRSLVCLSEPRSDFPGSLVVFPPVWDLSQIVLGL